MTYVNRALRRLVIERAGNCCEYCRLSQDDNPFTFHIEHTIAEKHGGKTEADNLALSCPDCNTYKGSDIGSVDTETGHFVALYNPRTQQWSEHFRLNDTMIQPITAEGRATVRLLRLNSPEQVAARTLLLKLGRYPC